MRFAALMCASAVLCLAQQKANVAGVVRDQSEAVIQGASVSIVNLDTGVRRMTYSNSEGFYGVSSLGAGNYKITVRKEGFRTVAQLGVMLEATETARFDFALPIGNAHETVTVEGSTPLLNIEDLTTTLIMHAGRSREMPLNGRSLQGLVDLAPGVLVTPATSGEAGQFSTNGQRPNTNYFTVDGVSANNGLIGSGLPGQFSGGALPAMSAIGSLHNLAAASELEEVRVQTSSLAPEFGRLPGAQVAVTTRSGSNTPHWDAFEYFRDRSLAANDWFSNRAGQRAAPLRLNQFGGSLSGPLRKDSTFAILSIERLRLRRGASFLSAAPSDAARRIDAEPARRILNAYPRTTGPDLGDGTAELTATVVSPGGLDTVSTRFDHTLGESGTAFLRYAHARSDTETGLLQRSRTAFVSRGTTVGWVSVLSPALTNDARFNMSRVSALSSWTPTTGDGREPIDLSSILPNPGDGQRLYALYIQGLGHLVQGDPGRSRQTQWNIVDTLAFSSGRHNIRLGLDYQRLTPARDLGIAGVVRTFENVAAVGDGGTPAIVYTHAGAGSSLLETMSFFAQDTWHMTPRLNITYGTRWEFTPPPSYRGRPQISSLVEKGMAEPVAIVGGEAVQPTPVWKNRATQFAPRIGLAYRLNAEGTLVLRAGAGLFYDLGFSSAADLINGAPYNRWISMATPAVVDSDLRYGFSPNMRTPRSTHWSFTLERALSPDTALSVAYVGSAGRDLLRREGHLSGPRGAGQLVIATNNGRSDYQSAQVQFRSRVGRGVRGVVSYSWAHSIDNGSWDSASFFVYSSESDRDRASSNFDIRHSATAALMWDLRGRSALTRNWTLSGIWRARTGFPIDVISTENAFGLGYDNSFRPNLVPGVPAWVEDGNAPGGRILNRAAFQVINGQGNLGRNAIRGNALVQTDLALSRTFSLTERGSLSFRLEAYNLFNQTNFGDPVRYLSSGLFGRSVSQADLMLGTGRPQSGMTPTFQAGGPRSLQMGVSIRF